MNGQPIMRCDSCGLEFVDERKYFRHCTAHIKEKIAAAKAQQDQHRKIRLPVETWTEVLSCCGLKSLAERVSFTGRLFHAIAQPMIDGPKGRLLPEIVFLEWKQIITKGKRKRQVETNLNRVLAKRIANAVPPFVELPVAQVRPPQNVIGFKAVELKYFDDKVLSFFCAIRPLLNNLWLEIKTGLDGEERMTMSLEDGEQQKWDGGLFPLNLATLECLLRVFPRREHAITSLSIHSAISSINTQLLARLLTNVRRLKIQYPLSMPASIVLNGPYPRNCDPFISLLLDWMHSPATDGRPKMACLNILQFYDLAAMVEQVKQRFLSASANSAPIAYFVAVRSQLINNYFGTRIELPFDTLRNEYTREVLTLRYCTELSAQHFAQNLHYSQQDLVMYRRSSSLTAQIDDVQMLQMHDTFRRTLFSNEQQRNKLVLNVTQMSEINESLYPAESADEQPLDGEAEANEPGPSSAKRAKQN